MKLKLSLRRKAVFATLIISFVLAVAASVISYNTYASTMDAHVRSEAKHVASTAAALLDNDLIAQYAQGVTDIYLQSPAPEFDDAQAEADYYNQFSYLMDDNFDTLYTTLENIKTANDVLFLYVVYMDPESMTCVYVVDADDSETGCPPGVWDIIYEENQSYILDPSLDFPAYITNTEDYGWLCSTGIPIFDDNGEVIAHAMVDLSMDDIMADREAFLHTLCAILGGISLLLILALFYMVNHVLVKPINQLASAATSYIADKNSNHNDTGHSVLSQLSIKTGDELENLCGAIQQMELDINQYIENLTSVTAEKERIGAELDVATHIQASMLPNIFPAFPTRPEFDIFATMTPAKEVGGDFYDFFLVDDNHLAVVIADVSGKGVPAALFMVIAKTLLKDHTQTGAPPAQVFTDVNEMLCETNSENLFVTAWMGVLDLTTGNMVCVNAGHNPPLLRHANGTFEYLKTLPGFVLAGLEGMIYQSSTLQLDPGDTLYLYTDGVTEATDAHDELYGEDRLSVVLNANKDANPQDLLDYVAKDIDAFVKEADQFDDITMVGLKIADRKEDVL